MLSSTTKLKYTELSLLMISIKYAGLIRTPTSIILVRMRYFNAMFGLILHSLLIVIAYAPLFMYCSDLGFNKANPVVILFLVFSINELLLALTPPSVLILPVCSFSFSMIIGIFIAQFFSWIYPFLIIGLLIFVLGLFLQFLINLT